MPRIDHRAAFATAHVGMALLDLDGTWIEVNDAFCKSVGYTRDELLQLNYASLTHPEDLEASTHAFSSLVALGYGSYQIEKRYRTKQGGTVWSLVTASLVAGDPPFVATQIQDITIRKFAEEALRRSESLFRAIAEDDLILVTDLNNRIEYCSPAYETLLGYSAESLEGTSSFELVHSEDRVVVASAVQEMLRHGKGTMMQLRVRDAAQNWHYLEAHGLVTRNRRGIPESLVVVSRLIDERIQAQRDLREAHLESELFINTVPSILIGLDTSGIITRWNTSAANVLGLAKDSVIGRPFLNCGIAWTRPDMNEVLRGWFASPGDVRCDPLPFDSAQGKRFLGLTVTKVTATDASHLGLLLTGADITERLALEGQLRQAQKLEAIGQLSAGIAHEINTPIQFIGDNVNFFRESWTDLIELLNAACALSEQLHSNECFSSKVNPEVSSSCTRQSAEFERKVQQLDLPYLTKEVPLAISQALEGIQRVAGIVRAMKEFSHPGSEELQMSDINRAIETTVTVARNEWKYVADVHTQLDPEVPNVPCIPGEINQVILNLIVNAAHAIGDSLQAAPGTKGIIQIESKCLADVVQISIRDSGAGIHENIRNRLFEPFFTTKEVGKGTGQGLALAHTIIVKKHNGKIWFESEVGKGTTFFIQLPLAR